VENIIRRITENLRTNNNVVFVETDDFGPLIPELLDIQTTP
jgi:hypothetical protein